MEMNIKDAEEEVDIFLKSHPYADLPKNERKYLINASLACFKRAEALKIAKDMSEDNAITLKAMVDDGVCSQGTIMHVKNHPALRDFVNMKAEMYNIASKVTLSESTKLELSELHRKIDVIVDKDAELLEAYATIEELKNEIKQKDAMYKDQINKLNKQLKSKSRKNIKDADFEDVSYKPVPELIE